MRHTMLLSLTAALFLVIASGCEKEDNPLQPSNGNSGLLTFSSNNVKVSPVYFSFDSKDSTTSSGSWDLKLTTMVAPDDTSGAFQFPGIQLNRTRGVLAKIVDGIPFDSVNVANVTGLNGDTDTSYAIGTFCLYYTGTTGNPPHRLIPYQDRTFVIKSGSGKLAKLRMLSYYNQAGTSGYMTFEYIYY